MFSVYYPLNHLIYHYLSSLLLLGQRIIIATVFANIFLAESLRSIECFSLKKNDPDFSVGGHAYLKSYLFSACHALPLRQKVECDEIILRSQWTFRLRDNGQNPSSKLVHYVQIELNKPHRWGGGIGRSWRLANNVYVKLTDLVGAINEYISYESGKSLRESTGCDANGKQWLKWWWICFKMTIAKYCGFVGRFSFKQVGHHFLTYIYFVSFLIKCRFVHWVCWQVWNFLSTHKYLLCFTLPCKWIKRNQSYPIIPQGWLFVRRLR